MIPLQLQNPEFRFVLLKPKDKIPFEKDWQSKGYMFNDEKLINHIKNGGNYGIIGGYGDLRIRDIDDVELADQLIKNNHIDTFAVKTGSGGLHMYYVSPYSKNEVLTNGEIRALNYQVVCPECIHPNGNKYNIISDKEIKKVDSDEIYNTWVKPYLRYDIKNHVESLDIKQNDESRSGIEFGEVIKLIRKNPNLTDDEIINHPRMLAFDKWSHPHHPSYRTHTIRKARNSLKQENVLNQALSNENNSEPFELKDISYFRNLRENKKFIVQGLIKPETLSMWASPPKNLKSIESLHLALCVASGREYYGLAVKKSPVLVIDLENPEQDKRFRILNIKEGLGLRKNPKLYYLSKGEFVDVYSSSFINRIAKTIEKYGIKLIVLDTLRRMSPDLKENEADDVSRFYRLFFQPLRDKYGVAVLFLHHMDKKAKNYRGSTDLQAMVDNSYIVLKDKSTDSKVVNIKIIKDCSRSESIDFIFGSVTFHEKSIEFESRSVLKEPVQNDEYKKLFKLIASYIENHGRGTEVKRASINIYLHESGIDEKTKRGSIGRILDYLKETNKIDMTKKGSYIWIGGTQ